MSSPSSTSTWESHFPNHQAPWSEADADHPVFHIDGIDGSQGRKAFFIHLEAKPGKEELLASFLRDINEGVNKEPNTGPWFGTRFSRTTFCIFEAFPSIEARNDHVVGPGGRNFLREDFLKDILAYPARVHRLDVLHGKFDTLFGEKVAPVS